MGFYTDFKSRLQREITENDIQLLGQIKVTDEEYKALVAYGRDNTEYATDLVNPKCDILLSLLMVQVAIFHYQEGNYWKYFEKELGASISGPKQNYLGKVFIKTIEFYKLLRLEKQSSQEQYVENIKAHAFVTNSYMAGFFEFATAFHENNLLRDLPPSSDDMIDSVESLSEYMKDSMRSSGDIIKSGSNKAAKSYKLLKATRRVFAQCDPVTVSKIFYPVLKTIDNDLFDQVLPTGGFNRFDTAYVEWRREQEKLDHASGRTTERVSRSTYGKKPYLKVDPRTEELFLVVPAQTFRKTDCEIEENGKSNASVVIRINDKVNYEALELRDSFGMYISEPISVSIPDVFDEIGVHFKKAGEKRFLIKSRDYRILTDDWKTVEKLTVGTNIILVKKGTDTYWNENCEIVEHTTEYTDWDLYSVKINKDSACKIGSHSLSVTGEYSKAPIFDNEIVDFEILDEDKNRLIATKTHPIISFEAGKNLIQGTILQINDRLFPLKDIPEENRPAFVNDGKTAVTIDINNLVSYKDEGLYSIELDIPTAGRNKICDYVLLRKIGCTFDYRYYRFQKEAKLRFSSPLHEVTGDPDWNTEESGPNEIIYKIPINPDLEYVDLDFYLNGESERGLYLRKPINVFSYGFTEDQKLFTRDRDGYIWHTELTDNLYVRTKDTEELYACYEDEQDLLYKGEQISPGVFRINISEIRQKIEGNVDAMRHHIRLFFDSTTGRSLSLGDILLKNLIFPNPLKSIQSTNGVIHIPIDVIKGEAESLITITDSETKQVVVDERPLHEGENEFPELDVTKAYDYALLSREGDEFGLFSETNVVRTLENHYTRDSSDLVGLSVKIEAVEYDGNSLKLNQEYRIRVMKKIEKKVFLGLLDGFEHDGTGRIDRQKSRYLKDVLFGVVEDGEISRAIILGQYDGKQKPLYYDAVHGILLKGNNPAVIASPDKKRYQALNLENTRIVFKKSKLKELSGPVFRDSSKLHIVENCPVGPVYKRPIDGFEIYAGSIKLDATRSHPRLYLEEDEQHIKDAILVINGKRYPVADMRDFTRQMLSQDEKLVTSIEIYKLFDSFEDGLYSVALDVPGKGIKHVCDYVLLKDLKIYLDKSTYILQDSAVLTVKNSRGRVVANADWERAAFSETEDDVYTLPIDPDKEYVGLGLYIDGETERMLSIRKPINIFSYGFTYDEKIFLREEDDYIWYKDLPNTLYIRNKTVDSVTVRYEDDEPVVIKGVEKESGVYKVDISKLRARIEKNKERIVHRVNIYFGPDTERYLSIKEILSGIKIKPDPLSSLRMNDGVLNIHVDSIIGKGRLLFRVADSVTDKVVKQIVLTVGDNQIQGLDSRKKYILSLLAMEPNAANGYTIKKMRNRENVIFEDYYSDYSEE